MGRRGGKARGKQPEELELSDRERALAALRRSLDSGNAAAVVAAGKALLEIAQKHPGRWESHAHVQQGADEFMRKLEAIRDRRRGLADQSLASIAADALNEAENAVDGLVEEMRAELGDGGVLDEKSAARMLDGLYEAGLIRPGRVMDGDPVGVVAELRRALADQPGRVAHKCGTTLDDMLTTLAEVGGVSPARFRALADVAEEAQAKRLEKATKAPEPKVEPEQAVTNGADVARPPFVDPAFAHALEERRSLGLGPVEWD
jgi:hypothetical protein